MNDTRDMLEKHGRARVDEGKRHARHLDGSATRSTSSRLEEPEPHRRGPAARRSDDAACASQLVNAVRSGNATSLNQALSEIEGALSGKNPPPLNDDERSEIAAASSKRSHKRRVRRARSRAERSGAQSLRNPQPGDPTKRDRSDAINRNSAPRCRAEAIAYAAHVELDPLRSSRIRSVVRQRITKVTAPQGASGRRGRRWNAADGGAAIVASAGAGNPDDESNDDVGSGGTPSGGAGKGTAVEPELFGGKGENAATDVDVRDTRVTSPWVGAPVRQLVAAAARRTTRERKPARARSSRFNNGSSRARFGAKKFLPSTRHRSADIFPTSSEPGSRTNGRRASRATSTSLR